MPISVLTLLPPVLAKDRHFLEQQVRQAASQLVFEQGNFEQGKKQGKSAQANQADLTFDGSPLTLDDLPAKLVDKISKSHEAVQARKNSVPIITLNDDLPVSHSADVLVNAIQKHQVIIVAGETGSGKTTQLPKIALLAGRGLTGQIGHTQPRRLAARSVANRIADELGEPLGQSVSFKIRFNETGSPKSLIKLMTDGILLAELSHDRFFDSL